MSTDSRWSDWHGLKGIAMENDCLKAVILPSHGGKLASLYDKRSEHEWLVQPGGEIPSSIPSGASFKSYSMYGWDEMFPTITACSYPIPGEYHGIRLPDHGEVWCLPWEVHKSGSDELILQVNGEILPYRLRRGISFSEEDTIRLRYQVENLSEENLAYLWAAHPFLRCDEGDKIVLPAKVNNVCNVLESETWGKLGTDYGWPETNSLKGEKKSLDIIGSPEKHAISKFYTSPEETIEWATLRRKETGEFLLMKWDAGMVPYLGFVVDEGYTKPYARLSFEPCSGFYDSLEFANRNHKISSIPAKQKHEWNVYLQFGSNVSEIPIR